LVPSLSLACCRGIVAHRTHQCKLLLVPPAGFESN